jgi:hypothetical protein
VPAAAEPRLAAAADPGVPLTRIGTIEREPGLRLVAPDGAPYVGPCGGYRHFEAGGDGSG